MTASTEAATPNQVGYRRLIAALFLPTVPLFACFQGIQQVLQPAQIEAVDPMAKVRNLAIVTALSSLTAVIGLVLGGALSDRTRTPWGRRNPWMVVMALASAALIGALAGTDRMPALIGLYSVLWLCLNFHQAALTAVLPDRVAPAHRGLASSAIGLATPIGIMLGVNLAGRLSAGVTFAVLAALLVAGAFAFLWLAPEPSLPPSPPPPARRPAVRPAEFLSAFADRDFSAAFVSRALLCLAFFSVNGYVFYVVKDRTPLAELPHGNAGVAVSILATTSTLAWILGVPAAGWLADRLDRRKWTVSIAAIGMALATIPPALSAHWSALLAFAAMNGLFFGIYMAVDLALMSLVLPNPEALGRDMAILNVASAGSQIFAPLLAGAVISALGYGALFGMAAALASGGGLIVLAIRKVR